jgi:hypothetical protein
MLAAALLAGGAAAQDSPEAQAQKIIAAAREAAGGEAKLKAVQSLSWSGKAKRQSRMMMGGGGEAQTVVRESDFDADALLPDKYVRKESSELMMGASAATIINHSGFNGEEIIQKMETIGDLPFNLNQMQRPALDAAAQAAALRRSKQDFLRQWLAWMFEAPAAAGVTFRSAGIEEVNGAKHDVVEAAGPDHFAVRFYFDAATHRLGMVRYKTAAPRQMMRMMGGPGGAQQAPPPADAPPPEVSVEVSYSDYKAVDGVQLPHRSKRLVNGEVVEETEVKKFKVNPSLKADKFKVN